MKRSFLYCCLITAAITLGPNYAASEPGFLREQLKASLFKIVYESYVNDNWEP